jgi:hypothetical protein
VDPHLLPHFIPNPKCYPVNLPLLIDKPTHYLNLNFLIIYFTPKGQIYYLIPYGSSCGHFCVGVDGG